MVACGEIRIPGVFGSILFMFERGYATTIPRLALHPQPVSLPTLPHPVLALHFTPRGRHDHHLTRCAIPNPHAIAHAARLRAIGYRVRLDLLECAGWQGSASGVELVGG